MDEFQFEAYQCFSRPSIHIDKPWSVRSTRENPIRWEVTFELTPRPWPIAVAELAGRHPTIGPVEFFDQELEEYLKERWPMCLYARGTVRGDIDWRESNNALWFARNLLWINGPAFPSDQRATFIGYRREFVRRADKDMFNQRRPSFGGNFAATDVQEPIGPGLVALLNISDKAVADELIWSEILKFPDRSTYLQDNISVRAAIERRQRHFNSHSELRDSRRHLKNGDHKATVRSAASAVEAAYRYCIAEKGITFPKSANRQSFDEKIETVLRLASLPSFAMLEPQHAQAIRYLYRARSSMHDGDCSYTDDNKKVIKVRSVDQVAGWVISARMFVLWMDAIL